MAKKKQRLVVEQCNDKYEYHSPCSVCDDPSTKKEALWYVGASEGSGESLDLCADCIKELSLKLKTLSRIKSSKKRMPRWGYGNA